jgi:hypothetical protein
VVRDAQRAQVFGKIAIFFAAGFARRICTEPAKPVVDAGQVLLAR